MKLHQVVLLKQDGVRRLVDKELISFYESYACGRSYNQRGNGVNFVCLPNYTK